MTPKDLKLCDSDYKFMTAVWESCPVNSGELVKLCNEKLSNNEIPADSLLDYR